MYSQCEPLWAGTAQAMACALTELSVAQPTARRLQAHFPDAERLGIVISTKDDAGKMSSHLLASFLREGLLRGTTVQLADLWSLDSVLTASIHNMQATADKSPQVHEKSNSAAAYSALRVQKVLRKRNLDKRPGSLALALFGKCKPGLVAAASPKGAAGQWIATSLVLQLKPGTGNVGRREYQHKVQRLADALHQVLPTAMSLKLPASGNTAGPRNRADCFPGSYNPWTQASCDDMRAYVGLSAPQPLRTACRPEGWQSSSTPHSATSSHTMTRQWSTAGGLGGRNAAHQQYTGPVDIARKLDALVSEQGRINSHDGDAERTISWLGQVSSAATQSANMLLQLYTAMQPGRNTAGSHIAPLPHQSQLLGAGHCASAAARVSAGKPPEQPSMDLTSVLLNLLCATSPETPGLTAPEGNLGVPGGDPFHFTLRSQVLGQQSRLATPGQPGGLDCLVAGRCSEGSVARASAQVPALAAAQALHAPLPANVLDTFSQYGVSSANHADSKAYHTATNTNNGSLPVQSAPFGVGTHTSAIEQKQSGKFAVGLQAKEALKGLEGLLKVSGQGEPTPASPEHHQGAQPPEQQADLLHMLAAVVEAATAADASNTSK